MNSGRNGSGLSRAAEANAHHRLEKGRQLRDDLCAPRRGAAIEQEPAEQQDAADDQHAGEPAESGHRQRQQQRQHERDAGDGRRLEIGAGAPHQVTEPAQQRIAELALAAQAGGQRRIVAAAGAQA
jgi:hypothetical protein